MKIDKILTVVSGQSLLSDYDLFRSIDDEVASWIHIALVHVIQLPITQSSQIAKCRFNHDGNVPQYDFVVRRHNRFIVTINDLSKCEMPL